MDKKEKRAAAFERMTPERKAIDEEKIRKRQEKKALAEKLNAERVKELDEKAKEEERRAAIKAAAPKRQLLKELTAELKAFQAGLREYDSSVEKKIKASLSLDDYEFARDEYIDLLRTGFYFRTPKYTHPVKTIIANFVDEMIEKLHCVEWGLIIGLLSGGYISKSLARILVNHRDIIIETGLGEFVYRFAQDIWKRGGNLEEDGSVSPFTQGQIVRVNTIIDLYRPTIYKNGMLEDMAD